MDTSALHISHKHESVLASVHGVHMLKSHHPLPVADQRAQQHL